MVSPEEDFEIRNPKFEMVSPPLVTIITPSLNQGRFIEGTIRSVLAQNYTPVEHRIYDAGSTDETPAILARYRDRVQAVIAPDRGQADAVNRGFREAQGEIVGWLNSDDVYLPGAISTAVAYLMAHPACAMVYGNGYHIDAQGNRLDDYPTGPIVGLRDRCGICQPTTFMRLETVAAVGYLDSELHYCMDYDLWLRLAARYEVGQIPAYLACTRLHADCKTVADRFPMMRETVLMTYHRLGATPLFYLYGYANLLVTERLATRRRLPTPMRRADRRARCAVSSPSVSRGPAGAGLA
jgi:glycosyltransferase involved in cell wall biosynthesis